MPLASTGLVTIDYAMLAIYLVGTLPLGLAIGWKFETGKDFPAGRSLPWKNRGTGKLLNFPFNLSRYTLKTEDSDVP